MKYNINQLFLIGLFSVVILLSCDNKLDNNVSNEIAIQLGEEEEGCHFTDDYYDFEIIPLETKKECMLGDATKVRVTDAGIYVYDYGNKTISLFNHDGSFKCKIGSIGHATSEYVNIFDLSTSINGDTIGIMTKQDVLKLYDSNGQYIKSQELPTEILDDYDIGWDNVLLTRNGILVSDFHRAHQHMLWLLDAKSRVVSKFIDIKEEPQIIKASPDFSFISLQYDNNLVCYYDQLSSRFYILNLNDYNDIKSYALKSDNILTEEKARKIDLISEDYDCVDSYVFADSMIVGNMRYKGYCCEFKFDLRDNSMKLFSYEDFGANFVDYYKGYYYKVLYSDFLADLMKVDINDKSTPYYKIDQYKMLHKALEPYKDKISEKDNYYLLKVKMKK